jgi:hypothetical protein
VRQVADIQGQSESEIREGVLAEVDGLLAKRRQEADDLQEQVRLHTLLYLDLKHFRFRISLHDFVSFRGFPQLYVLSNIFMYMSDSMAGVSVCVCPSFWGIVPCMYAFNIFMYVSGYRAGVSAWCAKKGGWGQCKDAHCGSCGKYLIGKGSNVSQSVLRSYA